MYVAAARSLALSTLWATRRLPVLSPPLTAERFRPADLEGHRLAYLVLHGLPEQPYLYGDQYVTAITAEQIRAARLDGQIVYLAACFGLGPVSSAFLAAGAAAVMADEDANYAGLLRPQGANALGGRVVRYLRQGETAGDSLYYASQDYIAAGSGYDPRRLALVQSMRCVGDRDARLTATA